MFDWMFFSRDVATLAAQIGPLLVVAFIVEFRAVADRRSMEKSTALVMLWIVFGSLALLLLVSLFIVNGSRDLHGAAAAWAWTLTLTPLAMLLFYVAIGALAAVRVASQDADEAHAAADSREQHLRQPGWKWFLGGSREPLHVVAAVIERRDLAVLAARRAPGKSSAGKWEFPGGKVEKGEQPAEALIREIQEELNVRVRIVEPLTSDVTVVGGRTLRLSCFMVKVVGKLPTSSTDHDRLEWVPRRELAGRDWAAPDLPAVRKLIKSAR